MAQELREGAERDHCVSVETNSSSLQVHSSSLQIHSSSLQVYSSGDDI